MSRREQLLAALESHNPGLAKAARQMSELPNAVLEVRLAELGIPVPAETEPAVATLAECLAAIQLPEPTPRLVSLAGGSDADLATLPARAVPSYAQVEALFLKHTGAATLEFLTARTPHPETRRIEMLGNLRHLAAGLLEPPGVGAYRNPDKILTDALRGGELSGLLEAWDRGEGCEAEPAAPAKVEPAASTPPARSAAAVEARERQAMGAKGAKPARASRIKATQQKALAKTAAADSEPNYQEGGWYRMPNLLLDLIAPMSGPVVKAYLVACRLADAEGSFEISHTRLAERIGNKHRSEGERAMRRLVDAGLIHQRWRGGPGRANGYKLASLARINFDTAKAVLSMPIRDRQTAPADS